MNNFEEVTLKSGTGDFLRHKCTEVHQPEHIYILNLGVYNCTRHSPSLRKAVTVLFSNII